MVAPTYNWNTFTTSQFDVDSPWTEDVAEGIRQNLIHLEEWIGDGYTAAKDHDHDGVNSATLGASVGQSELSTTVVTSSVARDFVAGAGTTSAIVADASEYMFGPGFSVGSTGDVGGSGGIIFSYTVAPSVGLSTRYVVNAITDGAGSSGIITTTYKHRYVTATSKDFWMWILYDTVNDFMTEIKTMSDHPSYNTGLSSDEMPHPFFVVPENHIVILLNNEHLNELRVKCTLNYLLPNVIQNEYKIDFNVSPKYKTPREIIEIDRYGNLEGEVIKTLRNGMEKKRRMVTGLHAIVEYKKLKLK